MSVYKKLQEARILLQNTKLSKSGKNKFAGYEYFELGDFLPQIQNICSKLGLCGVVSFNAQDAYLTIYDTDKEDSFVTFTSPMSSAALKGCHDVQNLGAVQTYLRRYLWTNAFEIVEHDALDATMGAESVKPMPHIPNIPAPEVGQRPTKAKGTIEATPKISGHKGEWQIVAPVKPEGDTKEWLDLIKTSSHMLLDLCTNEEDVMTIFKKNKVLFDIVKAEDAIFFKEMMAKFTDVKNQFNKE
jgi:ERF superfamily